MSVVRWYNFQTSNNNNLSRYLFHGVFLPGSVLVGLCCVTYRKRPIVMPRPIVMDASPPRSPRSESSRPEQKTDTPQETAAAEKVTTQETAAAEKVTTLDKTQQKGQLLGELAKGLSCAKICVIC